MIANPLLQTCNEFEGMMLSKLLPHSVELADARCDVDEPDDSLDQNSSGESGQLMSSLFGEAFAIAIERAGGIGVGRELAATLSAAHK